MSKDAGLTFGFTAAAAAGGEEQKNDAERYHQMFADCRVGYDLGYSTAWVLEHHFTDYYPTPSPLMLMSHLAAAFAGLSLGSCIIVAPWYNPLRLAEEIAMLSHFCTAELHLGFGRGTAKLEYDAYGLDMAEAKPRYAECMQILNKAFSGKPVVHHGEFFHIDREVTLRPTPNLDRLHFYGAVGSIESAPGNADMGMPVLCNTQFPPHMLIKILAAWLARADELDLNVADKPPVSANCLIADSDAEARDLARDYMSKFFPCRPTITKPTPIIGKTFRVTNNFPNHLEICANWRIQIIWTVFWTISWSAPPRQWLNGLPLCAISALAMSSSIVPAKGCRRPYATIP